MRIISFTGIAITVLCFAAFISENHHEAILQIQQKKLSAIKCAPDRALISEWIENTDIPLMPGAGTHRWDIHSAIDSAQIYFDQGMNMYYGFHIIESMASFAKAERFDPSNAMIAWARALALGPNINDVGYTASPDALAFTAKAKKLSEKVNGVEKMLVDAMSLRYSNDSTATREKLNQNYADAMEAVYKAYSGNKDVAALYADALMLQHPWELWNNDGTPKAWTPKIRNVLEKSLQFAPDHPGLNHYYIHVMEASPYADLATESADRLSSITPGLSHMVHMPSHIYMRTGEFNKGTEANVNAVNTYKEYVNIFPAVTDAAFLYEWHNIHVQVNCAMMAGRFAAADKAAIALKGLIDTSFLSFPAPMGMYVQYLYSTDLFINVRFGKWERILKMTEPAKHHVYANMLYHFARGMALAATGKINEAENEKNAMMSQLNDADLLIPVKPFSAPMEGAKTALNMLNGAIEMKRGDINTAIRYLKDAVDVESNMVYNEPRDWFISPKPMLGGVLLTAKRFQEAREVFDRDLKVSKDNVWSLYGLREAYAAEGKNNEVKFIQAKLKTASAKSDVKFQLVF